MNDDSFSTRLRLLSKDYYQKHISFEEYRIARKKMLNQIDEEFNGRQLKQQEHSVAKKEGSSIFMKTVAFLANKDVQDKDKNPSG